jgi:hypothetical protein
LKWSVQKACKLGVRTRWAGNIDDLRRWYDLYLETMSWHAVPPRPYEFFEAIWELLYPPGFMRLLLAENSSEVLAGSIFFASSQTVLYAFNGRRRTKLAFRPNDLIQWTAIHEFCGRGFQRCDFGEVAANNHGLAEFKSKWGAEPRRLFRYYYPAPPVSAWLTRQGKLSRIANVGWKLLPLKTTAVLSSWLYRYL